MLTGHERAQQKPGPSPSKSSKGSWGGGRQSPRAGKHHALRSLQPGVHIWPRPVRSRGSCISSWGSDFLVCRMGTVIPPMPLGCLKEKLSNLCKGPSARHGAGAQDGLSEHTRTRGQAGFAVCAPVRTGSRAQPARSGLRKSSRPPLSRLPVLRALRPVPRPLPACSQAVGTTTVGSHSLSPSESGAQACVSRAGRGISTPCPGAPEHLEVDQQALPGAGCLGLRGWDSSSTAPTPPAVPLRCRQGEGPKDRGWGAGGAHS